MKKEMIENRVLIMQYFHEGEGITLNFGIDAEAFKEFLEQNTNDDVGVLFEDLARGDFELKFKTISQEENRESCIQGLMWGDGITREEAIAQIEEEDKNAL